MWKSINSSLLNFIQYENIWTVLFELYSNVKIYEQYLIEPLSNVKIY